MLVSKKEIELGMAREQLSLADLSVKTGIPVKTLSNILFRQKTRPVTLGKIAAALEVDPGQLTMSVANNTR